jgi:hypothetical protein
MTRALRPLGLTAALVISAGVGVAEGQTVIVRGAPPAASLEATFEGNVLGTATVDPLGDGTVVLKSLPGPGEEVSSGLFVDVCGTIVRVGFVLRGVEKPIPGPGCERRDIGGFFVVRSETTLVVDLSGGQASVRIRQGRPPAQWLMHGPIPQGQRPPLGLVVFGGGGFKYAPDPIGRACGDSSPCIRRETKASYGFGAAYWLSRFLGGEVSFAKPASSMTAERNGTDYLFESTFAPHIATVTGLAGAPVGPFRFYGRIGANYHSATLRTVQATGDIRVLIDGREQVLLGGDQTLTLKTGGWGRLWGFGAERWLSPSAAVFAEMNFFQMRGTDVQKGDPVVDDPARAALFGLKFHFLERR